MNAIGFQASGCTPSDAADFSVSVRFSHLSSPPVDDAVVGDQSLWRNLSRWTKRHDKKSVTLHLDGIEPYHHTMTQHSQPNITAVLFLMIFGGLLNTESPP